MNETRAAILAATRSVVLSHGVAATSTRKVAMEAGVPLSQIHYHFGSKEQLVLATLDAENARLLTRQSALYANDESLSQQWATACDYLDDDLASGYVRILHEAIAAGFSQSEVSARVRALLDGWVEVLTAAFSHHQGRGLDLRPFSVEQLVALTIASFLGGEQLLLLGHESPRLPVRAALRSVGSLIEAAEAARGVHS
ncbi:MAG: TetR/AcrR family transcriptional regulator [Micropruina sp.]|nr:TetR/AcrR family transcriptional regulator [Micropruina sp.]